MLEDGFWHGEIMDQHIHLDRKSRYLDAINEFVKVGGTGINLVHKPDFNNLPRKIEDYKIAYLNTINMANEVRNTFDIGVLVTLGPHPVSWEKQIKSMGYERSTELHLEAVNLALEYISDGDAVCLGEVGRPHYPVSNQTWNKANELLLQIMEKSAMQGASIQLHVEDNGKKTYSEIEELRKKSKMVKKKVIRHFAPPNLDSKFTNGISSTISVGKGSIETIIKTLEKSDSIWGMETDFLDDMNRPGAVLGPKTVPKRTQELCRKMWELDYSDNEIISLMKNIHSIWPREIYA
jgi:TatD-related deoxyribonuclease